MPGMDRAAPQPPLHHPPDGFVDPAVHGQLSTHFSLAEFTRSDTALRLGIDNRLPASLLGAALATAALLEAIRAKLSAIAGRDVEMNASSVYRCPALNTAIGSTAPNGGDHPKMAAADWTAPTFGTPLEICKALAPHVSTLGIGQLIHEYGAWVHTSRLPVADPVNRIITIDRAYGRKRVRAGLWPAGV